MYQKHAAFREPENEDATIWRYMNFAMIYHAEMVSRAVGHALVIADMPFASYQQSVDEAIANAARILKETGCQAVKLESGPDQAIVIAALVRSGIPVMAHCGLRPQSIHQFGGYRVQRDREQLAIDAAAMAEAGAFAIVLECIPPERSPPKSPALYVFPRLASVLGRSAMAKSWSSTTSWGSQPIVYRVTRKFMRTWQGQFRRPSRDIVPKFATARSRVWTRRPRDWAVIVKPLTKHTDS